jgi:hypothetical protein
MKKFTHASFLGTKKPIYKLHIYSALPNILWKYKMFLTGITTGIIRK